MVCRTCAVSTTPARAQCLFTSRASRTSPPILQSLQLFHGLNGHDSEMTEAIMRDTVELNGLQDIITDFDDWLCRYKKHFVRTSNVSAVEDIEPKTSSQQLLYINSLLVNGYIHDKILLRNSDETKYVFVRDLNNGNTEAGCMLLISLCGVTWGDPRNPPVLLVHGYMDSAATFIPLVKLLPKTHYYVAIDLPGHGRSDPFPAGPLVTHAHQLEAVRRVILHLGWTRFLFVSHSLGFILGVLYNAAYPGVILRMVYLDSVLPLSTYCYHEYDPSAWYSLIYGDYYNNYSKWAIQRLKTFNYDDALSLIIKKRDVDREQAELLLSRTLVPVGNGLYRFSMEPSMRHVASLPITEDMLFNLLKDIPPTLNIIAQNSTGASNEKGMDLIKRFEEIDNFHTIYVKGSHDFHVTNPEILADKIIDFLNLNIQPSCKL